MDTAGSKITDIQLKEIANSNGLEYAAIKAFVQVETGGLGFDSVTGKIIIQFEPRWFKKMAPYTPSGLWSVNGVERQSKEWVAFNDAFSKDPEAAMKATSIGLGQIMGFHFKRIGYNTVGEMWDDAKRGEYQQVLQIIRFLKSDPNLLKAINTKNWHLVATYYNGGGYKELALKIGREPYNISLEKAYNKYKQNG